MISKENATEDVFRDSKIRYLGYANEVGTALIAFIPKSVFYGSWVTVFGYVGAEAVYKGYKKYNQADKCYRNDCWRYGAAEAVDNLLWQSLASVWVPPMLIYFSMKQTTKLLDRCLAKDHSVAGAENKIRWFQRIQMRGLLRRWGPLSVGLGMIPILPYVLDPMVDGLMENTYRKWFNEYLVAEREERKF